MKDRIQKSKRTHSSTNEFEISNKKKFTNVYHIFLPSFIHNVDQANSGIFIQQRVNALKKHFQEKYHMQNIFAKTRTS